MMHRLVVLLLVLSLLAPPAFAQSLPPLTPINTTMLAKALAVAHRKVFKARPKGLRVGVAWAQTALETGRGERLRGYNVGNIDNGRARYKNLGEGAQAYWRALRDHCASALGYFDVGDARGAAHQLARCGYYRADPNAYANGMGALKVEFDTKVWPKVRGTL